MPCARSDDALLDTEDWAFTLTLADPDTGQPRDLAGSAFRLTFRTALGEEIATASTDDESIKVEDVTAGTLTVLMLASGRTWRLPRRVGSLAYAQPVTILGDLMRRPTASQPYRTEGQAAIRFLVRPGTTEWPAPSP